MTSKEQLQAYGPMMSIEQLQAHGPMTSNKQLQAYGPMMSNEQLRAYGPMTSNEQLQAYGPMMSNEQLRAYGPMTSNEQLWSLWACQVTICLIQCSDGLDLWATFNSPIGGWRMAVMAIIWLINEWVRVFPKSREEEISLCFKLSPSPLFWGKSLTHSSMCHKMAISAVHQHPPMLWLPQSHTNNESECCSHCSQGCAFLIARVRRMMMH